MMPYCPYFALSQVAIDYLPPDAAAIIRGGPLAPNVQGVVTFKDVPAGVHVCVDISGLPPFQPGKDGMSPVGPFGFHIHENDKCEIGDPNDPFKGSGGHWNPSNQPHGNHINRETVWHDNERLECR